jgi:hypothetical protein
MLKSPMMKYSNKIAIAVIYFLFFGATIGINSFANSNFTIDKASGRYTVFNAKPLVTGSKTTEVSAKDSRAQAIDSVFRFYKCPIEGLGPVFVEEADKNNIPYWLVASIAFQESSCGKNTPVKDGKESNNLWGYGVWGKHVKTFETIEQGIAAVSVYMDQRFYSQGITELCDIMKVYTPPSQGSWCRGVGFFRDKIVNYQSPNL